MKLAGLIEGTPLEWTYDTGAINTFITEDMYYNILPEQRPVLERVYKKLRLQMEVTYRLLEQRKCFLHLDKQHFRFPCVCWWSKEQSSWGAIS